ncbi:MAG: hypothetical protein K9N06_02910 [Candidatus Cloacimonetes bacterium]|nr:hypothetical protein [Candidatus Cloacimonadota bacterium]
MIVLLSNSLIVEGELAEGGCRIADALRNYNWAYALLPTIPGYQDLTYYFEEQGEKGTYTGLENKMTFLLNKLNFEILEQKSSKETNYTDMVIQVNYDGKPVCGLLVYYNDGYANTSAANWGTGCGRIRLGNEIAATCSY